MSQTLTSFSTAAISSQKPYHVFINHRGVDVKKTLASHIYHRLSSARTGTELRVFLDQPELRVGCNFDFQIKDAIRTAVVHVAIFSPRYAESEWCLNELLYMLESKALIIPVFYHVEPYVVRWPEGKGVYAQALRILEMKKRPDGTPRHDPATIKKWREALSTVSLISGLDLDAAPFHGDEGALVEKIVQRVLQEIKSRLDFNQSKKYGGHGGTEWFDGTHSGVTRIIMTANEYSLTSVQLIYAKEGNESSRYTYFPALQHGGVAGPPHYGVLGDRIEYSLNYPEENLTKISGHFGSIPFWPESVIVIKSLTFHTNKGKYGPWGPEEGTTFETEEGGTIVGFFGSSGTLLDSIGVYMLKPITCDREASENGENKDDQIMSAVISAEDEDLYVSQKYGGPGGNEWNEGPYSGVTRIIVTANQYSLISLQMCYVSNVSSRRIYRQGDVHGGGAGPPHWGAVGDKIEYRLKYPDEILTKVSGYFGSYKPPPESWFVIKSLTFHTNKGTYGPCGQEEGTPFETEEGGTIIGFQGKSGTLLDSIGVYMLKPRTSDNEARQNGENEDNQIIPFVITLEDEAGESGENKDDQIMPAPISAEDEASENAENKDDQIMPASISAEDEASENAENKDDQIMHALISAEDEASENAENKDDQINCLPRENILGSLNRSVKLKSCLCNFRSIRITRKWIWNKVMFKCCRV